MKKIVWATGLFAAIVATGAFCNSESDPSDNQGYRGSSLTSILMQAHEGYQLQQEGLVDKPEELDVNESLRSRYIFECIYHNRAVADGGITTRKVMVVGSEGCGFSDLTSETVPEKISRIKGYVTSQQSALAYYLGLSGLELFGESDGQKAVPDLEDPEQVLCYHLYSDGESRQRPVSDYVKVVDEIYGGGKVVPLTEGQKADARQTLYKKLQSTATFTSRKYNGQRCNLALISENEYGQHSAGRSFKSLVLLLGKPVADLAWRGVGWGLHLVKGSVKGFFYIAIPVSFSGVITTSIPFRATVSWAYDKAYNTLTYPLLSFRETYYTPLDIGVCSLIIYIAGRYIFR